MLWYTTVSLCTHRYVVVQHPIIPHIQSYGPYGGIMLVCTHSVLSWCTDTHHITGGVISYRGLRGTGYRPHVIPHIVGVWW